MAKMPGGSMLMHHYNQLSSSISGIGYFRNTVRTIFYFTSWIVILLFLSFCSAAPLPPVNITRDGIAIKGYDPVAYFTDAKPVKGDPGYTYTWNGAKWLFANQEHLDLFGKDPEKYAPRYGGYCAYAVSQGTTADIDPDAWNIVDGKLYLNLDKKVQGLWQQDIKGYIEKADHNWPAVLKRR